MPLEQAKGSRAGPPAVPIAGQTTSQASDQSHGGYGPAVLHNPLVRANPDVISPVQITPYNPDDSTGVMTQETDAGPVGGGPTPPSYDEKWRNPLRPRN